MGEEWSRASWRNKDRIQMPSYKDQASLKYVEKTLNSYPPLVFAGETRSLRQHLDWRFNKDPSKFTDKVWPYVIGGQKGFAAYFNNTKYKFY